MGVLMRGCSRTPKRRDRPAVRQSNDIVIVSGVYNVAATAPRTALVRVILNWTMRSSVRVHAGNESPETWSEDQARKGFKEYDAMCVICHSAPGAPDIVFMILPSG